MDPSKIREKIGRFRILIIGRANAGKTTILQRVCNTRDNPEIFNSAGEKIDPAVLTASTERGEHNIEHEMVFRSNPGFVFHDSRGFEAGGESEFDKVKEFIAARSKKARMTSQLHVIWYCIPMDEASRSFTEGEKKFFFQCDTGSIPVMVLFTKFDALYDLAYSELKSKGASMEEAEELAPKHAEESFAKGSQLKFLKDVPRPPKYHVCLPNMNTDDANCRSLIDSTAGTLDDEVLQQLFVSTQQTNLDFCMKYAVERTLSTLVDFTKTPASGDHQMIIGKLGGWFPHILLLDVLVDSTETPAPHQTIIGKLVGWFRHILLRVTMSILPRAQAMLIQVIAHCQSLADDLLLLASRLLLLADRLDDQTREFVSRSTREELGIDMTDGLDASHREEMRSKLLSVASGSSPLETVVQLCSAAVIVFEHSFYIFDKQRYLQHQEDSVPSYYTALEQYIASPHAAAVQEAVSVAVHTYQETLSTWQAKQPSGHFEKGKQELIKTIVEITLEHRLPRP